ncbi:MAG: hypothetical protein H6733_09555 [Alphaproteobacteria bacterium]|nr:hypothetical protein [Alphaproteobacteria bacterium]
MGWSRAGLLALVVACSSSGKTVKVGDDVGADTLVGNDDSDGGNGGPVVLDTSRPETSDVLSMQVADQPFLLPVGDSPSDITIRVFSEDFAVSDVHVTVSSSRDGSLPDAVYAADDQLFHFDAAALTTGHHTLTFHARDPDRNTAELLVEIDICEWPPLQDFNSNPIGNGWQSFGDAYWDSHGWLEITGNAQSRAGSIYKVDDEVDPGDFRLEFSIATGGGINSGADGYSVNIVNVATVEELEAYIDQAANGGCLGYGIGGPAECGHDTIDAFHIEFDTWENGWDPTPLDHIAITMDGDPGTHVLWTPYELEDLQWRDVVVEASGTIIRVEVDGTEVINRNVPGFRFDGGYIGLSGSTGWATNFHRFDNLRIFDTCVVPP